MTKAQGFRVRRKISRGREALQRIMEGPKTRPLPLQLAKWERYYGDVIRLEIRVVELR